MSRRNRNVGQDVQHDGLYVTDLEDFFFGSLTEEIMSGIIKSFVYYFQVDEEKSDINIYGETSKLVLRNPIKLYALVEEIEPTLESNKFGIDQKKSITCYFHKRHLEEVEVIIHEGDYIDYNNWKYLIVSSLDTRNVNGVGIFRDTIQVTAIIPDKDQQLNK